MATRKTIGLRGEQEAIRYLRKRGYTILAHRERILRGDIDIIALDKRTIVFVEVRSKTSTERGHPAETVDTQKKTTYLYVSECLYKAASSSRAFFPA